MNKISLSDICMYRNETESATNASLSTFVSTESMLPNKLGIVNSSKVPKSGNVKCYYENDILISNIRPYFKKIWKADHSGTCSTDVLVFKTKACASDFLAAVLSDDSFFDYVMSSAKGTKMPRGDKKNIMNYKVRKFKTSEQKFIGATYSLLDKKLNQTISSIII